jgi:tetratricopeptide (TPR) repeat protein
MLTEKGCILVCSDGCFQYLPSPGDFENLLLKTLLATKDLQDWSSLLTQEYEKIKQDDISLLLYPLGFADFTSIKSAYQSRWNDLKSNYGSGNDLESLSQLWQQYRGDYEARLSLEFIEEDFTHKKKKINFSDRENAQKYSLLDIHNQKDLLFDQIQNAFEKLEDLIKQYRQQMNSDSNDSVNVLSRDIENILNSKDIKGFIDYIDSIKFKSLSNNAQNNKDKYPRYLMILAEAYYEINRHNESIIYFDITKKNYYYQYFTDDQLGVYAKLLFKHERFDDTIKLIDTDKQRNLDSHEIYFYAGKSYEEQEMFLEAQECLKKSLEICNRNYNFSRSAYLYEYQKKVKMELDRIDNKFNQMYYQGEI